MPKHSMRSLTALLILTLIAGCDPDPEKDRPTPRARAIAITNTAKEEIAAGLYAEAIGHCLLAEEIDDTYDEAKYCIVAANVGAMAKAVSDILGLVVANLSPAEYRSQLALKGIVASILDDVEAQIRYIDAYSYKLTKMENPKFHIDDFPLNFDPAELLKATGIDEIKVTDELSLNLKGTWDMSEIIALAALLNGVQGLLDYVMAHKLVVDNTDIAFETTGDVAAFIATNPNMLTGDPADKARLSGDDNRKGFKNDILAALSYLVGRDDDLENVAPKNAGLIAAIKQSALDADPDAVLKWVDKNGDGIPEQIGVPSLEELRDKIVDADGKPVLEDSNFQNFLSEDTWKALIAFGKTMRDNIEAGGGKPAPVARVLELIVGDLKTDFASTRLLQKKVPDVVALDPGKFFKSPKYINELFPYFYEFSLASTAGTLYDLAIDTENYVSDNNNYLNKMGVRYKDNAADFAHFSYPDNDAYSTAFTVTSYTFPAFSAEPVPIAADGIMPTAKTPRLWYFALLDPTFGGVLLGDAEFKGDASGGNYVAMDNLKIWKGLNKLLKYYCIDTTSFDLDMFNDDAAIYVNNKIADCNQALE